MKKLMNLLCVGMLLATFAGCKKNDDKQVKHPKKEMHAKKNNKKTTKKSAKKKKSVKKSQPEMHDKKMKKYDK